jgi:hypothetical protein
MRACAGCGSAQGGAVAERSPDILARTAQPRYPNGERKLARDGFTQATWVLLGAAALAQLLLLVWLDVLS